MRQRNRDPITWRDRVSNNLDECLTFCTTPDLLRIWAEREEEKRERYHTTDQAIHELEVKLKEMDKQCLNCRHELDLKNLKKAIAELGKTFGIPSTT